MAVNFTTNIALAKPTDTELALNWARGTKLQEDNNIIIVNEMDKPVTSYTPVLAAQTTAPTVGSGGAQLGEYQDNQGIITGTFMVSFFTAGITAGSGEYGISLPFVVDNSFHSVGTAFNAIPGQFSVVGEGFISDSSAVATSGSVALDVVTVGGVSYARLLTEAHTTPAKTSRMFRDAMPFTVADGDLFIGNFCYKKL